MSSHNLGMYTFEEKLNEEDEEFHSEESEDEEFESEETDSEILEQEEVARNQQLRLQERFLMLENTLFNLRNQLRQERDLWKREIDEMTNYCGGKCYENCGDLNGKASQDTFINSTTSLDLEPKVSYCANSYNERKAALQRQIAYNNFQRRLLEVENMCNLELLRVKQSAQSLEPLRLMVSEWNRNTADSSGDGGHNKSEEVEKQVERKSDTAELVGSKLYNEINDMFNKVVPWQNISEESSVSNSSHSGTYISDGTQSLSN